MRVYKINRALESTPKVIELRTPNYLFIMALAVIIGFIMIVAIKDVWWALLIISTEGGIYLWLRRLSDDTRMDVRASSQPERIEGYRDDGI